MPYYWFVWDEENEDHVAQHGISREDFEQIVCDPDATEVSRTSGRPVAFGNTSDGRYLMCVYEMLDELTVYPVTAFEVED